MFFCLCVMLFMFFKLFFSKLCMLCLLLLCMLFDCKCKSLNRLGENIKQKHKEIEHKHKSFEKNRKQQKYRISSPRTSANICIYIYIYIIYLFAEVRGLDILYFCFCFMFFSKRLCFCCSVSLCFFICFRLVYLRFCIYNRNTYTKESLFLLKKKKQKKLL